MAYEGGMMSMRGVTMPKIIFDARKVTAVPERISSNIVQGVLESSGLPTLKNIIPGVSKEHFMGHEMSGGHGMEAAHEANVVSLPGSAKMATRQKPGGARYLASQDKRRK